MFKKQNNWRDPKFLAWVKQQPSIISVLPSDDPHHIKGHGLSGGTKAPDWAVLPLTREEHDEFHHDPVEWEEIHGSQVDLLMKFWRDNFEEIRGFLK